MKPWKSIVTYVVLAYAFGWLVALPLWLDSRHLAAPYALGLATLLMFTPMAAALLTLKLVEKESFAQSWLAVGIKPRSVGRMFAYVGIVAGLIYLFVLGGLLTSSWFGTFHFDLEHFSGLQAHFEKLAPGQPIPMPLGALAAVMIVSALVNGVLNTIPALGEEIGWRGFLFPRLQEVVGTPAALALSGLIWGCWHAPLILLGYNYPNGPRWLGLLAMSGMCTVVGAVLSWVTARSGTIWPAAYGHGLLNALAGSAMIALSASEPELDLRLGTIMGVGGWLIPGIVVVLLFTVWKPGRGVGQPATAVRQ